MRTKTLILSALAGAFCSASLMAQVYSVNSVGYINVTCPPGFSLIANQLNNPSNNFISPNLLETQMVANSAAFNGCTVWKYISGTGPNTGWQQYIFNTEYSLFGGPPWSTPLVTNATMNPGEGVFFNNVNNSAVTLTFVGTVPTGSPVGIPVSLYPGLNVVSSQVPIAGAIDTTIGLTNGNGLHNGDTIYTYNTAAVPPTFEQDIYNTEYTLFGGPPWSAGASPTVSVGQSFFYYNTTSTTNSWTTSFSVN